MLARLHTSRQFQEFGSPTDRSPLLLRLVVITIFAIPANMVFAPLGAVGYVSMVLAIVLFALWLLSALMGLHDPIPFATPAGSDSARSGWRPSSPTSPWDPGRPTPSGAPQRIDGC